MPTSNQIETARTISSLAYRVENYNLGKGKSPKSPEGLVFLESVTTKTGMTAVAYKDEVSGEIYIGYTGTNPSKQPFRDIGTDATIAVALENAQIPAAFTFYEKIVEKYPDEKIILTGHSLGGGNSNGVNTLSGGKNLSITFNAAPLGHFSAVKSTFINKGNFYNYRTSGDPLTVVGGSNPLTPTILQVLETAYPGGLTTVGPGGHNAIIDLDTQFDWWVEDSEVAKLDHKKQANQEVLNLSQELLQHDLYTENTQIGFDTNHDGMVDTVIKKGTLATPISLLTGKALSERGGSSESVSISPELLYNLSASLTRIATTELAQVLTSIDLMEQHNQYVGSNYKNRITQGTSDIEDILAGNGLKKLADDVLNGYKTLVKKQSLIQNARDIRGASKFNAWMTGLFQGTATFAENLQTLSTEMNELNRDLTQVHYKLKQTNSSNPYQYTSTTVTKTPIALLGDLKSYIEKLPEHIEKEFIGDNKRSKFKDGLQEALAETFKVQKENVVQIQQSLIAAATLTQRIAENFEERDAIISRGIADKTIPTVESLKPLPVTYDAFLKENDIFDDVRNVIDAWDTQITRASENIEKHFIKGLKSVLHKHKPKHNQIYDSVMRGSIAAKRLVAEFNNDVIESMVTLHEIQKDGTRIDYEPVIQWGNVGTIEGELSESERSTIKNINQLLSESEQKLRTISGSWKTFDANITTGKSSLERALREQIYKTTDLDEIVHMQNLNEDILDTMIFEIYDVIRVLVTTQQGVANDALIKVLSYTARCLEYQENLTVSCFL